VLKAKRLLLIKAQPIHEESLFIAADKRPCIISKCVPHWGKKVLYKLDIYTHMHATIQIRIELCMYRHVNLKCKVSLIFALHNFSLVFFLFLCNPIMHYAYMYTIWTKTARRFNICTPQFRYCASVLALKHNEALLCLFFPIKESIVRPPAQLLRADSGGTAKS